MLRQLPAPAPEEVVHVTSPGRRPGGTSTNSAGGRDHVFSYPLFRDLERLENTGLSHIAAEREFDANLSYGGQTERGNAVVVSGGFRRCARNRQMGVGRGIRRSPIYQITWTGYCAISGSGVTTASGASTTWRPTGSVSSCCCRKHRRIWGCLSARGTADPTSGRSIAAIYTFWPIIARHGA